MDEKVVSAMNLSFDNYNFGQLFLPEAVPTRHPTNQ
jgi:hypothetical protein